VEPTVLLARVLFLFGIGFLAANAKVIADLLRFRRRRRSAQLTWPGTRPALYGFSLGLGVLLGLLLAFKLFVQRRPPTTLFGEAMMFVYYGYAYPLSMRIERGFYGDGVWTDSGFMHWHQISAVSWKEGSTAVTLVLISRARSIARLLEVPGPLYGQARRFLLDKVKAHDIHIGGAGLDLGSRDVSDEV
jgi:hypothetical protein